MIDKVTKNWVGPKYDVYKGDLPGSAWKWVATYKGKVLDVFPTKKEAWKHVLFLIELDINNNKGAK
tara:strand:+ start:1724 stop:1921 length:198 start_codon:yes stop_codon:yes gene_type:complete